MPEVEKYDQDRVDDINEKLVREFRANGGKVTGIFAGMPLLLLTTIGARSGQARTTPLVYTKDGERFVIIASKGGAPTHPGWYHNLVANPSATVEIGTEQFEVSVSVAKGEERDSLFDAQAAQIPVFADYQRTTNRLIPVLTLERVT